MAAFGGRKEPVPLMTVINGQKSYSKTIKECPEHFGEGYYPTQDMFTSVMEHFIPDPYKD